MQGITQEGFKKEPPYIESPFLKLLNRNNR